MLVASRTWSFPPYEQAFAHNEFLHGANVGSRVLAAQERCCCCVPFCVSCNYYVHDRISETWYCDAIIKRIVGSLVWIIALSTWRGWRQPNHRRHIWGDWVAYSSQQYTCHEHHYRRMLSPLCRRDSLLVSVFLMLLLEFVSVTRNRSSHPETQGGKKSIKLFQRMRWLFGIVSKLFSIDYVGMKGAVLRNFTNGAKINKF